MLLSRPVLRRVAGATAAALAVGIVPLVAAAPTASAAPTELFISEYVEGSSNNKAVEIYNGTGAVGRTSVRRATACEMLLQRVHDRRRPFALAGTVANGRRLRLRVTQSASAAILAQADQTTAGGPVQRRRCDRSGQGDDQCRRHRPDRLRPRHRVGQRPRPRRPTTPSGARRASRPATPTAPTPSTPPSSGTASPPTPSTASAPTRRSSASDALRQWPRRPGRRATRVAPASASVTVTFSEPVNVADGRVRPRVLAHRDQDPRRLGRPDDVHARPDRRLRPGDAVHPASCRVRSRDQDAIDPPDIMAADRHLVLRRSPLGDPCVAPITPIPAIQGSGRHRAIRQHRDDAGCRRR